MKKNQKIMAAITAVSILLISGILYWRHYKKEQERKKIVKILEDIKVEQEEIQKEISKSDNNIKALNSSINKVDYSKEFFKRIENFEEIVFTKGKFKIDGKEVKITDRSFFYSEGNKELKSPKFLRYSVAGEKGKFKYYFENSQEDINLENSEYHKIEFAINNDKGKGCLARFDLKNFKYHIGNYSDYEKDPQYISAKPEEIEKIVIDLFDKSENVCSKFMK